MEMKFCQSCGMPLSDEVLGTEANGAKNEEYCIYCYKDGGFTADCSMDEMIEFCVAPMKDAHPEMTREEIVEGMRKFFPTLKRWQA
ncbi:MAG: zinc ribbon domain-containing protein [Oscillospiraceae bacterium]|nr:zinc ribbon domain-containing protein [Oscillospiraceae bacterium]MBP1557038.1 zinc ribbon domain-containing protein [Oscillospiraceae bacterium]